MAARFEHYRFTKVDILVTPMRGQHKLPRSNTRWQDEPQSDSENT